MNLDKETRLAALLIDLEAALRNLGCWDAESPSLAALQSPEPFCIDTLEFYQWLQWIFIPRIYHDLAAGNPLPKKCAITPVAEQWAMMRALSARDVLLVLGSIDALISGHDFQGQ